MNDSRWTWRWVSLISIAATVLFMVGFGYAVNDIIRPQGDAPATSLPQENAGPVTETDGVVNIVVLGDSLAKGTGDNSGAGFVKRAAAILSKDGLKANVLGNLGINGLTTAGLQSKLEEEGVQYALRQANTIFISIGGNDLFRGSELLQSGNAEAESPQGESAAEGAPAQGSTEAPAAVPAQGAGNNTTPTEDELTPESLLAALPEASERLAVLLETISGINPDAGIYYLGLYNPFGDIPDLLVPGNQAVAAWNNAAMDIINRHSNMTLVPTFDLFHNHLGKYLSSDHFHPSGEGYERIAARIVQAVH